MGYENHVLFAMYFSAVAGIQFHPANPPDKRMSLEDAASVAIDMLQLHRKIFHELDKREYTPCR